MRHIIKTTKVKTGSISRDRKRYSKPDKKVKRLQLAAKYCSLG